MEVTDLVKKIILFIIFTAITIFLSGCSSVNTEITNYANKFVDNVNNEITTCNSLISDYNSGSSNIISENYQNQFNSYLKYYQSPFPDKIPLDLKNANSLAIDGTTKIISGITVINNSPTNTTPGEKLVNDGIGLIDQSSDKYNSFKDSYTQPTGNGTPIASAVFGIIFLIWAAAIFSSKWFKRHVNLAYILTFVISLGAGFVAGFAFRYFDPFADNATLTVTVGLTSIVFSLIIAGWVINQKGRSLWWILLAGIFSPVWLANYNEGKEGMLELNPKL